MADAFVLSDLDRFRVAVMMNLATSDLRLDIVDEHGETPVVVALDDESLATLMRRVANTGGYANVFARGAHVRQVSVLRAESALFESVADDMTAEAPSGAVTVGAFLDYVETQKNGVNIPAVIPSAMSATVRNPRDVVFA
jgi:hypothetical protein